MLKHFDSTTQVLRIAYCLQFREEDEPVFQQVCEDFLQTVREHSPDLLTKVKVHMLLHLVESMKNFGPTSAFCTER